MVGERFAVDEVGTIYEVGATLAQCGSEIGSLWATEGAFVLATAAMPNSAIGEACADKDALVRAVLGRAASRLDQVAQTCFQAGQQVIDTEDELASGFNAISEF